MSVTYPRGFRAAGVTAGFKPSGLPDLGLLVGDPGTTAAAMFTTNAVAAAPVEVGRDRLARGRRPRGAREQRPGERGDGRQRGR